MKMKFTKKIATILLSVCLIVPCFSVMALAANGVIFFSDLETSVGDEFTITGTAVVSGDVIGDATIHMTYDPSYMRFEEGDGVNADTDGNLTFKGSGDGSSDRIEFTMKFQALQEGSTRLEQGDAMVTDSAGSSVACEEGYADVTIGAGDPSKIKDVASGTSVTIDGQEYTLSGDFSDSMIPAGFTAGEITYNDSTYKGAVQEKTGLQMAYLVDGDGKGDFWMYDSSDSSFSPAEQVVISDTYSIVIFDAGSKVSMPSKYSKGNLEINGKTFEIWDEPDRDGFYVLYAVNNDGEESLYLYDSVEHTYQRMETPKSATTPDKKSASKFDAILEKISDHLIWFVAAAAVIVILLVIFLLVSVVKLHNRNRELDDLYDEYGIDLDEEEEALKAKKKEEKQEKKAKKASKQVSKKASKKYDDENEFEGYDEDDLWVTENIAKAMEKPKKQKSVKHATAKKAAAKGVRSLDETGPAIRKPVKNINLQDTDDFEKFTPLDEEEFDNFEGYYSDDDYDMFGSNDYDYDDDELFDATADLLSNHPEKKRSHAEMDDTFKMDVIDLD